MNAYDILIKSYKRNIFSYLRIFKRWLNQSEPPEKFYKFGLFSFSFLLIPLIGFMTNIQPDFLTFLIRLFLNIPCILCAIGFMCEAKNFLINTWKKPIGKSITAILVPLVTFISFLYARYKVNLTLGVDPSHLPYALTSISAIFTLIFCIKAFEEILKVSFFFLLLYIFLIYVLNESNLTSTLCSIQNSKYYRFLSQKKIVPHHQPTKFLMKMAVARIIAILYLIIILYYFTSLKIGP
jgi:hypothetical protein